MAIILYKRNEHPSGFIGIRLSTTLAGEYFSEYYSFRKYGIAENDHVAQAELLDKVKQRQDSLRRESKKLIRQKKENNPDTKTTESRQTGVTGLTLNFAKCNKKKKGVHYYYPIIRVANGNKGYNCQVYIGPAGLLAAWHKAVTEWGRRYEISQRTVDRVKKEPPSPDQYKVLRRQLNARGKDIPISALTNVYVDSRLTYQVRAKPNREESLEDAIQREIEQFHRRKKVIRQ